MMGTIGSDLECFGVRFDTWFSESTIAKDTNAAGKTRVDEVCAWLLERGIAYEKDDALWFATTRFGDDKDRVLRRSDGRYTYFASDIAYHKNKLERGYNKLINLWGADHHGYVARMKAAIQTLGATPETLNVILYQLVSLLRNGVPVAMSTRAGQFETLEDVVREVGKDACRFFFMLRAPDSQLEFDLELAKKQSSDNPVFYVQYVRARCCSIFKEAATRNYERDIARADLSLLVMKEEREMIKKLASFGDILELCARSQSPHHLTAYLMETADTYHRFYERCRVLGDDRHLSLARLALVEGVAVIIKNGLNLLGVSAPDQM
jgi:arginyl-tRNA synthetase